MHYTVNVTPCLFKCSTCAVVLVYTVDSATQLWMPHEEGECAGEKNSYFSVICTFSLCFNNEFFLYVYNDMILFTF